MKALLVVLDGAADRKIAVLGGKTPLQAAHMPNLNNFTSGSFEGIMYPIKKNVAPESDAAVFSILGYDVNKEYTGRGPIEAFGAGLDVDDNTLALRCNFATIDKNRMIIDRRAGRSISRSYAKQLEKEINKIKLRENDVKFRFKATVGHRAVVTFSSKSKAFSPMVSNADIGYIRNGRISTAITTNSSAVKMPRVFALDRSSSARYTAAILNEFLDSVISRLGKLAVNKRRIRKKLLPANAILMRDAGVGLPKVTPISKKYSMSFAFVTEMPVERGISRLLGMKELHARWRMTKIARYREIAKTVMANSNAFDFIYVHLKGPDEPGHDGNAIGKKTALEEIDSGFFAMIPKNLGATLCIAEDHSTPCELKAHSADPVPVMIKPSGKPGRDSMHFDEGIDSRGSLGVFRGIELVRKIIEHMS